MRAGAIGAIGALLALSGSAAASPRSDAIARHGDADLAALRAQRADAAARCTLGAVYARRDDLPRAALYLTGCEHADLPDDIATAVQQAVRVVKRRLDASRHAALDVISHPEGLTAEIDALPGESFTTPATIWVAPGVHVVRVTRGDRSWVQPVTAEPHTNGVVVVDTEPRARPRAPRTVAIDFGEDSGGALGEEHTAPPPAIKHPSLIGDKYRGVPTGYPMGWVDDPLARRIAPPGERPIWLGLRLAAGMFDDGAAAARAGFALAAVGRVRLTRAGFASGRVDWSRRGGDAMAGTVDALGASAGLGATVLGRASSRSGVAIALIGQLRADLRLTDMRAAEPVRRAGLGLAAGAELALPATPFTVGVRVEQGVTELVAGARDRAVLAEVGVDLR
jgi:hypothetical protein